MKKLIIIFLAAFLSLPVSVFGQEKGLFLTMSGNYGANVFQYTLKDLRMTGDKHTPSKSEYPLSWGAGLSLQYFFNKHWGLSLGFEWFDYNGKASWQNDWLDMGWKASGYLAGDIRELIDKHYHLADRFIYENMSDLGGDNYTLLLGMKDWEETQHGYVVQIPLMAQYQTKWGAKKNVGMYFSLGAKFQLPVLRQSYAANGLLRSWAHFPGSDLFIMGDTVIPGISNVHGFGQRTDTTFTGNNQLRFSVAASGEVGFLFSFSRRVDFSIGAYLDYGFLNVRKKDNAVTNGALIMPADYESRGLERAQKVGDGLSYNGFLNSVATDRANLLAVGAKATLRIKLSKLDDKAEEEMSDREFYKSLFERLMDTIVAAKDTFIVNVAPMKGNYSNDDAEEDEFDEPVSNKKMWNANNPASLNNPENPNYAYPEWYTPDYVNNPQAIRKNGGVVGLGADQEGPNNPASVKRNADVVAGVLETVTAAIYFNLDSYELTPEAIATLDQKIPILKKYPRLNITLIGHTCDLASEAYNDVLSQNRCKSVRNYLAKKGFKANRIELVPMGLHHPDHPNNSEANRKLNRRVDCIVAQ